MENSQLSHQQNASSQTSRNSTGLDTTESTYNPAHFPEAMRRLCDLAEQELETIRNQQPSVVDGQIYIPAPVSRPNSPDGSPERGAPNANAQDREAQIADSPNREAPTADSQNRKTADSQDREAPTADSQDREAPIADSQDRGAQTADSQNREAPTADFQNRGAPIADSQNRAAPTADSQDRGAPIADSENREAPTADSQDRGTPIADTQHRRTPESGEPTRDAVDVVNIASAEASSSVKDVASSGEDASQDRKTPIANSQDHGTSKSVEPTRDAGGNNASVDIAKAETTNSVGNVASVGVDASQDRGTPIADNQHRGAPESAEPTRKAVDAVKIALPETDSSVGDVAPRGENASQIHGTPIVDSQSRETLESAAPIADAGGDNVFVNITSAVEANSVGDVVSVKEEVDPSGGDFALYGIPEAGENPIEHVELAKFDSHIDETADEDSNVAQPEQHIVDAPHLDDIRAEDFELLAELVKFDPQLDEIADGDADIVILEQQVVDASQLDNVSAEDFALDTNLLDISSMSSTDLLQCIANNSFGSQENAHPNHEDRKRTSPIATTSEPKMKKTQSRGSFNKFEQEFSKPSRSMKEEAESFARNNPQYAEEIKEFERNSYGSGGYAVEDKILRKKNSKNE